MCYNKKCLISQIKSLKVNKIAKKRIANMNKLILYLYILIYIKIIKIKYNIFLIR